MRYKILLIIWDFRENYNTVWRRSLNRLHKIVFTLYLKFQDIFTVKNILVRSVYCCTNCTLAMPFHLL